MSTDDVLQTFVAEARELLLGMEDSLLALERDPRDGEAISATFPCKTRADRMEQTN